MNIHERIEKEKLWNLYKRSDTKIKEKVFKILKKQMSKRFTLNKIDFISILKVLMWTAITAVVGVILNTIFPAIDLPQNWIWVTPVINTALIALYKFCQNKIDNR